MSQAAIIKAIICVQDLITLQIPVDSAVVFGEFNQQPMRTVWTDDELQELKDKILELVARL